MRLHDCEVGRTMTTDGALQRGRTSVAALLVAGALVTLSVAYGDATEKQAAGATSAASVTRPPQSLSLSPAVVMLRGRDGGAHSQTLRLTNHTTAELEFQMVAEDVVTREGKRVFIPAGDLPDSIAATAVFSQNQITVRPGQAAAVDVTFTIPPASSVRAVAAFFRGQTRVTPQRGVAMTASLGTLITFNVTNDTQVGASTIEIFPQSETENLSVSLPLTNTGSEPVVPGGMVVFLDERGVLVGRMPMEPQRLLPGERLQFKADYPTFLKPGGYRALVSFEYEGKVLTESKQFVVPVSGHRQLASSSAADPEQ